MPPREGTLLGVSGRLKSIVKRRILRELCKRVSGANSTWTDLNDLYVVWCVLYKVLPFGGHDDCTCFRIFNGVNFLKW